MTEHPAEYLVSNLYAAAWRNISAILIAGANHRDSAKGSCWKRLRVLRFSLLCRVAVQKHLRQICELRLAFRIGNLPHAIKDFAVPLRWT